MDWNGLRVFVLTIVLYIQAMNSQVISGVENSSSNEKLPGNVNIMGENGTFPVLSRRKRFLVFPDGSSLQLVFCVQTSAVITIGDIFLYGNTAALAWSLPTDPAFFHMIKGEKEAKNRGDMKYTMHYVDENGHTVGKVPYQRRRILNPTIAKRSIIEGKQSFKDKLRLKINRMEMHKRQLSRGYLNKTHMEKHVIDFHRSSRVGLYEKIELILSAFGQDGRQCVLFKLCESAQESNRQQGFLQEMLRIVFTLPKGEKFEKEKHKEYDDSHKAADDCRTLYPGCESNSPLTY